MLFSAEEFGREWHPGLLRTLRAGALPGLEPGI
ncbi:hypothetical protein BKA01_002321 [Pseudonocardia eucalypti]|nr:hypothetical protein [Pseudonocardia eucalypti]